MLTIDVDEPRPTPRELAFRLLADVFSGEGELSVELPEEQASQIIVEMTFIAGAALRHISASEGLSIEDAMLAVERALDDVDARLRDEEDRGEETCGRDRASGCACARTGRGSRATPDPRRACSY